MRIGDNRAQALQVGAIILFAFLFIAFVGYQTFAVPDQNRGVEFNHFVEVKEDIESVRNGVIEAGEASRRVPVEISLGTNYPPRSFSIQPAPPSGSVRSQAIGDGSQNLELQNTDASLNDICGLSTIRTRQVAYQPNYNYLQTVESVRYENTVTYTEGTDGGRSFQTGQNLVDGTTITLYPLLGDFEESGSETASITLTGGETGVNSSVPGPFELILPTRLSVSEWNTLLSDEEDVTAESATGPAVTLSFDEGRTYAIRCSPSGVDGGPSNSPTVPGASGGGLNPNFGTDVVLVDTVESGSSSTLEDNEIQLEFNNTSPTEQQNITGLRFPYYLSNDQGNNAVLPDSTTVVGDGAVLDRLGAAKSIDKIVFDPGDSQTITIAFSCGKGGTGDSFDLESGETLILTAFFEDGERREYFIVIEDSGNAGKRCK